jgi:thiamine-phosphate pyrophosphorylase
MASLTDLARRLKLALVAVTDERRGADPLALAARLPRGSWLIFRHYDAPDRSVLATRLAVSCRARRITLMVAKDFDLARRLGAGLHLPDRLTARAPARIRLWIRRGGRLTVAAHDRTALRRATALGADAALLSPIFATASHPGAKPLGLLGLRRLTQAANVAVFALGGIDQTTGRALAKTGIAGLAAVGALKIRREP